MKLIVKILKISVLSFQLIIFPAFYLKGQPSGLAVIDPLVGNEIKNITGQDTHLKVVTLPDEGNPIEFITGELKKSTYSDIHLYMLTKPGSIIFDEINIIPDNIQEYSGDFSEWKKLIKPGSEIVIHSADLTSVPEGLFLIRKIMEYTGKSVIVKE